MPPPDPELVDAIAERVAEALRPQMEATTRAGQATARAGAATAERVRALHEGQGHIRDTLAAHGVILGQLRPAAKAPPELPAALAGPETRHAADELGAEALGGLAGLIRGLRRAPGRLVRGVSDAGRWCYAHPVQAATMGAGVAGILRVLAGRIPGLAVVADVLDAALARLDGSAAP